MENIVSMPVEQGHGTAEGRGEREKAWKDRGLRGWEGWTRMEGDADKCETHMVNECIFLYQACASVHEEWAISMTCKNIAQVRNREPFEWWNPFISSRQDRRSVYQFQTLKCFEKNFLSCEQTCVNIHKHTLKHTQTRTFQVSIPEVCYQS